MLKGKLIWLFFMGAFGYTGFNSLFYISAKYTSAINLGIIQVSRGEFGSARRSWENVLRLAPGDSTTSQFLRKLPKSTFLEILE